MNIALWIVAGLLAVLYLASGVQKLAWTKDRLVASGMPIFADIAPGAIKGIAVLEILGAVGLVLPAAVGVMPFLVPLAATGLVLLMASAIVAHGRRGEVRGVVVTLILLLLAAFVAVGRAF